MTEENISVIGITIIFILVGAFAGSIITSCCMDNSQRKMLCRNFYSNTQDYIACLNKPFKEIIEEIRE